MGKQELLSLLWLGFAACQGKGGDGIVEGKLCLVPTTEAWGHCWDGLVWVYEVL